MGHGIQHPHVNQTSGGGEERGDGEPFLSERNVGLLLLTLPPADCNYIFLYRFARNLFQFSFEFHTFSSGSH